MKLFNLNKKREVKRKEKCLQYALKIQNVSISSDEEKAINAAQKIYNYLFQ